MSLVTRLFPALAVIVAAFAYFLPGLFDGLGDLIVPLLTLVMFAMGLTLDDFRRVARRPSLVVSVPVFAGLLTNTWLGHRLEKLAPPFPAGFWGKTNAQS